MDCFVTGKGRGKKMRREKGTGEEEVDEALALLINITWNSYLY